MKLDLFGTEYDPSGAPLTQERLKEILHYDPETGEWRWLVTKGLKSVAGQIAGYLNNRKYWHIRINNVSYISSRLAWFYMTGEWPINEIDHKDMNRANDKWSNLRQATKLQNSMNTGPRGQRNTSGYKGVYPSRKRWYASITIDRKKVFLGSFAKKEMAHEAYKEAALKYHGEFANFGEPPKLKFPDLFA
jgi:hypothetical protein